VKAGNRAKKIAVAEYKKSIGKQASIFNDKEVRRDYFKSHQWVEQHVKIKVHLTGYATCYESFGGIKKRDPDKPKREDRPQGSLFSQQKHAIADAIEWIRQNSQYKPRIFVATTPGYIDPPAEGRLISTFTNNLRMTYGALHYVWVRELTKAGYPHFHFVADIPQFDPVQLSLYWSKQFGVQAKNCIRLGSRPDQNGRRKFWIENSRMAWYLGKYVGKDLAQVPGQKKGYRTFAISEVARKESEPVLYTSFIAKDFTGRANRRFLLDDERISDLIDKSGPSGKLNVPFEINPRRFSWKWTGHGETYSGFIQKKPGKTQKKA